MYTFTVVYTIKNIYIPQIKCCGITNRTVVMYELNLATELSALQ